MGFRYKVILRYDGTKYVGFQVQENGNSIQAELNKALRKMTKGLYIQQKLKKKIYKEL